MTSSAGVAQRRGWYYGWNIVGACILAEIAASALPANAFSLFLHDWSTQLNCSISTLQLGIGAFAFIVPLLSPFSGVLADKYPARLLFGIGLVVIALFCVAMSYITAAWQMVALFALLLPIGTSFSTLIPANAVVSRWFVKRLGLALGLTAFGLAIGGVVLPPIVAMIMPTLGWRMIWRIGGLGIGAFVVPTVVYVLRDRPTEREGFHYLTGEGAAVPHHGQQGEKGAGLNWRDILKRRNFWLLLAIYLPMLFVYGGSLQNLAPIAISHGLNQQEAGALVSVFNAAHIVATLVMGMLSDRFGNRLPLLGLALVCATGAIVIAFGQSLAILGLGCALVGLGGGLWPLLGAATAAEFGANEFGRAFGLLTLFIPSGALIPFIIAKVRESTGSYAPALIALAILCLLGGAACLMLRERREGNPGTAAEAIVADVVAPRT